MSDNATTKLFNQIEKLTSEIIEWNNQDVSGRGVIFLVGEDYGDDIIHRKCCVGGNGEILGDLLLEVVLKYPTSMIPILETVLDAAQSQLKQNN